MDVTINKKGGGSTPLTGNATADDVVAGKTFMNASGAQTGTLTLSGTAAAGDVLQGKTFYNTDAKTVQTGTLVVSGSSGNATAGDVLKGKTFMNASGPATGTLELTGNAVAANVLSGKTFYSTDAKTKLTGSFTVPGNATAADVLKGKTFISNGSTTTKTGTLQLSGTATAADVVEGKTFYNTDAKTKITGIKRVVSAHAYQTSGNLATQDTYTITFPAGVTYVADWFVAFVVRSATTPTIVGTVTLNNGIETSIGDKTLTYSPTGNIYFGELCNATAWPDATGVTTYKSVTFKVTNFTPVGGSPDRIGVSAWINHN